MSNLESYYNSLSNTSEEEFKRIMNSNNDLTREEKCYLYYYLFPRPLLDKELPVRIQSIRGENRKGSLSVNFKEVCALVEACNTLQYNRFMKHIFHAFTNEADKLFPISGKEERECPICGKKIFEVEVWDYLCKKYSEQGEENNKEFLAFGSTESKLSLCLDCIIQLKEARFVVDSIDPSYLDWRKRYSKQSKLSWEDFKL